jgi:tRNA-uridine 2-sulfurtransferase
MKKKKVALGMSGGVDSSVAAYILKQQGYEVIGITMKIWDDEKEDSAKSGCCGLSAIDDARAVADKLDIPYYVLNFKEEFKTKVIDYFVDEYKKGRTPNPCIACNRFVKWESLLQKAMQLGADYIATGHYAKIIKDETTNRYSVKMSKSIEKDQTYALYNLTQFQLERTLMPVGDYTKTEIRKIAKDIGLLTSDKPDSQEICFIPDNDYPKFIKNQTKEEILPGNFIDTKGNVIGKHKGVIHYTIGQRKGLGIAFGKPMFVKKIDVKLNTVTLCENIDLFETTVYANDINFMGKENFDTEFLALAKIRYSHQPQPCKVSIENGRLKVVFNEPQRAITPGQALVIYNDEGVVLGGGVL